MNINLIKEMVKNTAAADIFKIMADPEESKKLLGDIQSSSDEMMDFMAIASGVPQEHFEIYRKMMKGEDNDYFKGIAKIDGLLRTGDIIMTGGNRDLVNAQKVIYRDVKSSHVAIIHAEYICVDAMPKPLGVSSRMVSEVLSGLSDRQWQVMRLKNLPDTKIEKMKKACSFFLAQPYLVWPSAKPLVNYSYCSELVRKIYNRAEIKKTGIPDAKIIAPAHFDKLFDSRKYWDDVTEQVRPAVEFCREYESLQRITAKLFIEGLKLNRQRFKERHEKIQNIKIMIKDKKISKAEGESLIHDLNEINKKMHHQFWDFTPRK